MQAAGLILAAGKGARFPSETEAPFPKVLRGVLGRPMVLWVLDALEGASIDDVTLVIGFGADEVRRALGERWEYVPQPEQKGSGHATACAKERFSGFAGTLVVMCGDSPLFASETIRRLVAAHERSGAAVTLVSALLSDPIGYGRIVRNSEGRIARIVEEKCAGSSERKIREVNGGAYAFGAEWLFANIDRMVRNEAGEYNLTDMVRVAVEQGMAVSSVECDPEELLGINNSQELAAVEAALRSRQV